MTATSTDTSKVRKGRFDRLLIWIGSLLVVTATLGILGGLAFWKYEQIQQSMNMPPPPEMPMAVEMETIEPLVSRNSTSCIGTILAPRSITVNNELPGTVLEVSLEPGSIVESGDVLLRQDISVEEAQLKSAEARESYTKSTLERTEQLARSNAVTVEELENFRSQRLQAQAQLEELKAVIARKTIKAPFRGRIGICDIHEGQYLAGGTMITTLQSIEDHLLVDFTLPQGIDSQISEGDLIEIVYNGKHHEAKIQAIDAQADRTTRNVRVRARLDLPPDNLSPGDSVQVVVEYGQPLTLPSVSAEALQYSPQGTFIYVVETDNDGNLRARLRPAMPGSSVGNRIGLLGNIPAGTRVVSSGSFKLKDGMLIAPANSPADPAAGAETGGLENKDAQPPAAVETAERD